ncbi:MAG: hypothetical protein V1709_05565 [Planctomycetota bacterium]
MRKAPFLPREDQAKADMLDNLALKLPTYAAILGVTPAEVTSVWDYKAIYKISDDQVGQFSEPIQVTVTRKTGY